MNWTTGFSARYYMELVDAASWRDIERYDITGGSIARSAGDLMEAADIDMTEIPGGGDAWVRVYLDARQGDSGDRQALFTGLLSAPTATWDGVRKTYKTECYSVLKPPADVLLSRGWYAPAGTVGATLAAELLSVGAAPVSCDNGSPRLVTAVVAENGETHLSMARKILAAIDWRIRISGNGEIHVCPKAASPSATFDALENDIVELAVTDSRNWFSCPNVFRAISGDLMAIARDDDPNSPLSTVSRGREIWREEANCALSDNENIAAYALRRLAEEQAPVRTVSYARRYQPDVYIGDIVTLNHPAQGISGEFRITSQKIELGYGARTTEEAQEV